MSLVVVSGRVAQTSGPRAPLGPINFYPAYKGTWSHLFSFTISSHWTSSFILISNENTSLHLYRLCCSNFHLCAALPLPALTVYKLCSIFSNSFFSTSANPRERRTTVGYLRLGQRLACFLDLSWDTFRFPKARLRFTIGLILSSKISLLKKPKLRRSAQN